MKRFKDPYQKIPLRDYGPARQEAVSWLGDRYLLAEPQQRVPDKREPFFFEIRRWHPTTRH